MIIIIDAYNLLRTVPPYKKTITDQERKRFIAQLARYGHHKGHKIVIVFDGGPYEWPQKEKMTGVTIVYSGIHDSADDYIREYIIKHRAQDLLLVTSDRELNRYADHYAIPSIDSIAFYQLLQEAKVHTSKNLSTQGLVKTTKSSQEDVDQLMRSASAIVPEKSEDINVKNKGRTSKKRQLVKEERVLLKKLRKL